MARRAGQNRTTGRTVDDDVLEGHVGELSYAGKKMRVDDEDVGSDVRESRRKPLTAIVDVGR